MARVLRITINNTDYNFSLLNKEPITKNTTEIPIHINSQNITLVKASNSWQAKDPNHQIDKNILESIGRAIGLRYRF
ncbi:hypothetical protein [Desertivirga arenae]|uniref:hypothetical protein n=1 Tax=Desertivirga arenae TaxID=2810309 RepID=UPI001A95DA00|nr:hypothetical protein [Pedobacter sp. SYSU D00823]